MDEAHVYIAIDLKSFYASVECVERGLDPLTTNLVVADPERTEKTICLAVSPSLKAYGIPGRARLFEVVQKVKEVNAGLPSCGQIQLSPLTLSSHRRAWRSTWITAPEFTISICVMWRRRIFMSILSTRCLWMSHIIWGHTT